VTWRLRSELARLTRGVLVGGVVIGGLVSALVLGRLADDRGLPGSAIAVVVLCLLALLSLRIALGELPPRGRRRSLAIAAEERAAHFRVRFRVPGSMRRLPTLSDSRTSFDGWHLVSVPGDPRVLLFDLRTSRSDTYESSTWWAMAACEVELDAPALLVEPRPPVTADPLGPFVIRSTESGAFGRRYRVRTGDRLFATAFLDQRMLEWMLDQRVDWTFEVGGRWAMVSRPGLDGTDDTDARSDTLLAFRQRIPRVVSSMHAPP
jgi:hypothetical protein